MKQLKYSRLAVALAASLLAGGAYAQQQNPQQKPKQDEKQTLDRVVVTGSLIPQSEVETVTPVTTIKPEEIDARGFTSVTEALQQNSSSTGGTQGEGSDFASFTKGAETISLFGLAPGYTKYLIDGRPMANYPALYNGSDVFNNISGIPVDLVDRVEILPGGQSSLYGSDAIAGVVNFILKKNLDGTVINARYGWYDHSGGESNRVSISNGFRAFDDRLNVVTGVQVENRKPVWSSQRDLTRQFNTNGHAWTNGQMVASPPIASRDWLVYGYKNVGTMGFDDYGYAFSDPNNCANVRSAFGGTADLRTRPGSGQYCGSFNSPGYRTLRSGKRSIQLYNHTTFDLTPNAQLYADFLYNQENVRFNNGASYLWWGTGIKWGYFYDPAVDGLVNLQRAFAPEDIGGGWDATSNKNKSKSYTFTVGVNGTFGASDWDYDVFAARNEYQLKEHDVARLAKPINDWFEKNILGPQQGWDPYYGAYPVFQPDYAKFYSLLPAGAFESFTGGTVNTSKTYDNTVRGQITNGALFSLPGGDAGLAVAAEWGKEGWKYDPDPLLLTGGIWGTTGVSGAGDRSRYALTTELRLPIVQMLTVSASGRYDAYKVAGETVSKPTYSVGLEFRPFRSLLLRGKYGTAFKVPTLADQFQGLSGFYSSTVDYYNCARTNPNFDPGNIQTCNARYRDVQFFGQTKGNPSLDPINADVWSLGIVFAPTAKFSISADYFNWKIKDEVSQQSTGALMRDEMNCRMGKEDINSALCKAALGQITRGPTGALQQIFLNKVNVSEESLRAIQIETRYTQGLGRWGTLGLSGQWSKIFEHTYQQYPGDRVLDIVNDPYYSTDPIYKANASASWNIGRWSTTLYGSHIGPTPNYRASATLNRYDYPGAAKLGSYTLYNGSVSYEVTDDLRLSFMVNNLFDKMPTMDTTYPGTSSSPYNSYNFNPLGRSFYVQARWSIGNKK